MGQREESLKFDLLHALLKILFYSGSRSVSFIKVRILCILLALIFLLLLSWYLMKAYEKLLNSQNVQKREHTKFQSEFFLESVHYNLVRKMI